MGDNKRYRLTNHGIPLHSSLSFAFKSTPEWQELMRNPDVEISVIFHNETSADLYANDELHSSIVISDCDQTDIYSRTSSSILEYKGTALKRMTIMSHKSALPSDRMEKMAVQARREASHIDNTEIIASKVLSKDVAEPARHEQARKRARDSDEVTMREESKKTRIKETKKNINENEKRSRYVKLSKVPFDCCISSIMSFLRGFDDLKMFVAAHSEPQSVAVYVECRSLKIANLIMKRSGESVATKSKDFVEGAERAATPRVSIEVQRVAIQEASWAKAVGARLVGSDNTEIGQVWIDACTAFAALLKEEHAESVDHKEGHHDPAPERAASQTSGRGLSESAGTDTLNSVQALDLSQVHITTPALLATVSARERLGLPHPDQIFCGATDGIRGGAQSKSEQVSYSGHFESRAVSALMPLCLARDPDPDPDPDPDARDAIVGVVLLRCVDRLARLLSVLILRRASNAIVDVGNTDRSRQNPFLAAAQDACNLDLVSRLYALYTKLSANFFFRN